MATPRQITVAARGPGAPRKSLKSALYAIAWAFVITLALRFIVRDALHYFTLDERTFGRFWPRRAYLLPHILSGMTALLLGPLQFWSGLRRRALGVHRWIGRLYLLGILLAAGNAFYLAFFIASEDGGWMGGVPLFTQLGQNPSRIDYGEGYGDFYAYYPKEERGEFDGEVSELIGTRRLG